MISHNLCPFREPTHEVVGDCGPHAYAVRVLPAHFGLRRRGGGGPARRAELCSCASSGDCVSDQCTPHAAGRSGSGTWRRERCPAIVAKPLGCCTAAARRRRLISPATTRRHTLGMGVSHAVCSQTTFRTSLHEGASNDRRTRIQPKSSSGQKPRATEPSRLSVSLADNHAVHKAS